MKDWVIPYLVDRTLELVRRRYAEKGKDVSKERIEKIWERKSRLGREAIFAELVGELNCDFGGGLGGPSSLMRYLLGSVLARLPREAFLKLRDTKNLFLCYTPSPGAEVKVFDPGEKFDPSRPVLIVTFPQYYGQAGVYEFEDNPLPSSLAVQGSIAHELAHVYLGHTPQEQMRRIEEKGDEHNPGDVHQEMEDEADDLVRRWGFVKEVEASIRCHQRLNDDVSGKAEKTR